MSFTTVLSTVVVLVLILLGLGRNRYTSRLPPGPRGIPLLGNALELPTTLLFIKLHEWSKRYGPIVSFAIPGQRVVVVNTAKAAGDVLDRLSTHSSNRPPWIKMNQFLSRGHLVSAQQGENWRRMRRATHEVLNPRSVSGFRDMQTEEAIVMVRGFLQYPDVSLEKHFHRASRSIVWRAVYGGPPLVLNSNDTSERLEQLSFALFIAALPGKSLVDMFPFLRYLYARSKWLRKNLDDWYLEATGIYLGLYAASKDTSVGGARTPCVSNNFHNLSEEYGVDGTTKAWTAGSLVTAGLETTAAALTFFLQAMLLYPEVMHRAHADLDHVVGERTPTFEDKDNLPYIFAIVKEVLRWRPPTPMGVPHAASEDFQYGEYVIPKGTWILDNLWNVSQSRDPALYHDPETFDPSRFLDSAGKLRPGASDSHDDWLGFGHGRRICPGQNLAINSLFITFAYLLWAFDFHKEKDANGKEVVLDAMDLADNTLSVFPAPFKVEFAPRIKDLYGKLGLALVDSV
ncbi:cytochrome P450 [Calocera viscosa TUFC12733]|uniref:Cytochrome P450 n=1 Tax=Calocera viscosa (strain TUFC12733) TaxID=1330018 RepID=A0A167IX83_CALVF|nr:cytochrome P450 [Calocera viscosa TUFC12733]